MLHTAGEAGHSQQSVSTTASQSRLLAAATSTATSTTHRFETHQASSPLSLPALLPLLHQLLWFALHRRHRVYRPRSSNISISIITIHCLASHLPASAFINLSESTRGPRASIIQEEGIILVVRLPRITDLPRQTVQRQVSSTLSSQADEVATTVFLGSRQPRI